MPTFLVIHDVEPDEFAFSDDGTYDEARDLAGHVYRFLQDEQDHSPSGVVTVVNEDVHDRLEAAFHGGSSE